jgi:hypothetical protein
VANKSEYWDDVDMLMNLGERVDHPFKLNIFADHKLVGELWLTNKMEPVTMTVPLFNAQSLMFWLEPGPTRSGQFVFYDMKLSKAPCDIPVPEGYHPEPAAPEPPKSKLEQAVEWAENASEELKDLKDLKATPNTDKQCWEVEYKQGETVYTVYGWLTKEELLENINEMQNDGSVSNISYQEADATDKAACEALFDNTK